MLDKLEAVKEELRSSYRIKFVTDYCWVIKYNVVRVMCHRLFRQTIEAVAQKHKLVVDEWHEFS